jgi:hypothetical protein
MAGSVNIAARRQRSANITIIISTTAHNNLKAQRSRDGLKTNSGAGSSAPAAESQKPQILANER